MRKLFTILVLSFLLLGVYSTNAQSISRKAMIDSLTTVDPEVKKYFPRSRKDFGFDQNRGLGNTKARRIYAV